MSVDGVIDVGSVTSPIGDPRDHVMTDSSWHLPVDAEEIKKRLDLLESNVRALPAMVAECVIASLSGMTYAGESRLSSANVYAPSCQESASVVWHGGLQVGNTVGLKVDLDQFLLAVESRVSRCLRASIDFSELDKMRARIKELEEDLGYRQKVAEKLREEPAGS